MDVVLLNTGPRLENNSFTIYRTLGPYKLANTLRNSGFSVQVIDHLRWLPAYSLVRLLEKFVTNNTLCLGISSTFLVDDVALPAHLYTAIKIITDKHPYLKIVVGGPFARSVGANLKLPRITAIFEEYSEDTFLEYIQSLQTKNMTTAPPFTLTQWGEHQPVLSYKKPRNQRFNIEHDAFQFHNDDCIMPNETLPLEISRGCIFKCKFCNHLMLGRGKLDYLRDFELVKNELIQNYSRWGTTNYYIICDTFNDTEFKMKAWHEMISSLPFKIKYTAYLRADLLDKFPDVPYMLQETGLLAGFHGIESLGESASMTIGKGWSGKRARDYIPELYHNIWKQQVKQTISMIVGLPGDTRESLLNSAEWFRNNNLYNISWHPLGIRKGSPGRNLSEFERDAEKYGYEFVESGSIRNGGYYWKTDYWTEYEAEDFAKTVLRPHSNLTNARHGSWTILQLMQYGVTEEWFEKEKSHHIVKEFQLHQQAVEWISNYVEKLLAL
jgi:hypothetical protein